ncbi:ribonuclease P protein subunit p21 [Thalassophryne amazonica]|uniref:ribonuclease P protein subunit p21 n=1 Tax=Thalassophryne amazonica TaxID=390379 RepID=UPI001471CE35|nr:ribonuclease P protein subunit p21 [Thalassophryne amazonica]
MAINLKDKEAYQRLNYLYQAAHCVLSQNPQNVELARFYCFTQKTIARRLVLRQDPSVKRTLCKKCCCLLIPGITATSRQRRKNSKTRFTVVRCLSCGQTKMLLNNPDHCLWGDRPEAQLQHNNQPDRGSSLKEQPKHREHTGSPTSESKDTAAERQEQQQPPPVSANVQT